MSKFEDMTVAELKAAAKDVGITGYSKMRKQELVNILTDHLPQDGQDPVGRHFDEVDDVLETVDDMTGFPCDAAQGLENLRAANKIGYSHGPSAEAVEEAQETMKRADNDVEKPVRFHMNRAMRRKQAALARRAAKRAA